MELHEAIQELHALATVPELYELAVEQKLGPALLGLLSHENTDISVAVVNLLQELTDIDTLNESQEEASVLIDSLLEQQICSLLVHNLERLDERQREESDGVHNSLGIRHLSHCQRNTCDNLNFHSHRRESNGNQTRGLSAIGPAGTFEVDHEALESQNAFRR